MATLWIAEGYQKNFERKIDSYCSKISEVQNQYKQSQSYLAKYLGDSNVSNCNTFLKKRITNLESKKNNAITLKEKANQYCSDVISADTAVANSIHSIAYSFYKKKGIGPQSDTWYSRAWNSVKTGTSDIIHDTGTFFKNVGETISEIYEQNKYVFNIIGDVIAFAAATALVVFAAPIVGVFGVICLIGAAWAMSKAVYDTVTDCMALDAHYSGDEARAEALANSSLSGLMVSGAELLDKKLEIKVFEPMTKIVLGGLETCEFVCKVIQIYESFISIFKLENCHSLDLRYAPKRTWKQNLHDLKMINFKGRMTFVNLFNFTAKTIGISTVSNVNEIADSLISDKNREVYKKYREKGIGAILDLNPLSKTSLGLKNTWMEIAAL